MKFRLPDFAPTTALDDAVQKLVSQKKSVQTIQKEAAATGQVALSTYTSYLTSCGRYIWLLIISFLFFLASMGFNVWGILLLGDWYFKHPI